MSVRSLTHSLADSVTILGGPSERWLLEKIRTGKFPARKVGKQWRMTDADIEAALEVMASGNQPKYSPNMSGLTQNSRKRLAKKTSSD